MRNTKPVKAATFFIFGYFHVAVHTFEAVAWPAVYLGEGRRAVHARPEAQSLTCIQRGAVRRTKQEGVRVGARGPRQGQGHALLFYLFDSCLC